jgi:TIR domain
MSLEELDAGSALFVKGLPTVRPSNLTVPRVTARSRCPAYGRLRRPLDLDSDLMDDRAGRHVFVSYVREDSQRVDGLCAVLEAAGIPYWRDIRRLEPGDAWKRRIRSEIKDGALVFLACFSENSRAREKTHMNEELTIAIEEFRLRSDGATWLIPARFDDGDVVPDLDLGAGRTLSDLNFVNLFEPHYAPQAAALVTKINRLLGDKRLDAASALAAVEQATAGDRTDMLKRMTKEMLLDPARRIELDELVAQEVARVVAVLTDPEEVSGNSLTSRSDREVIIGAARQAQQYLTLVEPFCASLQVAVRWGSPDALAPWAVGLRAMTAAALKVEGGLAALLKMRGLPAVVAVMTAGVAATGAGKWANLTALVVDPTVRDAYEGAALSVIEAVAPYDPFASDWIAHILARTAQHPDEDLTAALTAFETKTASTYFQPVADWLHAILRPIFTDQLPQGTMYDEEWDRGEVMLGLISQDLAGVRYGGDNSREFLRQSRWFGRSTWRAAGHHGNPVADFAAALESQRQQWPPVRQGLFGADADRALRAIEGYGQEFNRRHRG